MAVLEKIREKTVLVLFMIGLGMFAFLFMGSDQSSIFSCAPSPLNVIGSIYEEDINREELDEILARIKENENYDTYSEELKMSTAWDQMIQDKLISTLSEVLGLDVTPEEIYELETGAINSQNLNRDMGSWFSQCNCNEDFIEDLKKNGTKYTDEDKKTFLELEKAVIKYRYLQKYQTLIEKGIYTTNTEMDNILNYRSENATVRYVNIPYTAITEDITITDQEINNYYNENILDYQNDRETRNVECAIFPILPSNEDDSATREEIEKISAKFQESNNDDVFANRYSSNDIVFPYVKYDDIIDEKFKELILKGEGSVMGPYRLKNGNYRLSKLSHDTLRPDKIEVSQILISQETVQQIGDSAAISMINDWKKRLKNGEDFGLLASQFSEGDEKSNFGYVGEISETDQLFANPQSDEESIKESNRRFISACFDAKKEGSLRMVITIDGYHLLKITRFIDVQKKYKIVYFDREVTASENTRKNIHYKAQQFIKSFNDQSDNLSFEDFAVSEEYGEMVEFYPSPDLDNMKFKIKNLANSRGIVRWMFDVNTKKGDLSGTIYSCGENYVVVSLSGINDEGNKPRHLVKEEIYQELLDQKRFNLAAARIPMGSTLEEVASIFDAKIDVLENINFANSNINIGNEENFVGVASATSKGNTSLPFRGSNSIFVLHVESKSEKNLNIDKSQRFNIQKSNSRGIFFSQVMNVIKDHANIVDNRIHYY